MSMILPEWGRRGGYALVAGLALCLATSMPSWADSRVVSAKAALAPASMFFGEPTLHEVRLSPDGRHLALHLSAPGRRAGLYIYPVENLSRARTVALFEDLDVHEFHWVNDERLVFNLVDGRRGSAEQRFGAGLFSVRVDGEDLRQLIKVSHRWLRMDSRRASEPLDANHLLLEVPRTGGQEVIVGRVDFDAVGDVTAVMPLRLNVLTGRTRQAVERRPGDTKRWWFDRRGEPVAALSTQRGRQQVHLRQPGTSEWQLVQEGDLGRLPWMPHSTDVAGRMLVLRQNSQGFYELARWDEQARAPEAEALVSTPGFDFIGSPVWRADGEAMAGLWVLTDAWQAVWFDPDRKRLQDEVDARLRVQQNLVACRRCGTSDQVALVRASSPAEPGRWFLLRGQPAQWTEIGRARRDVDPRQTASVEFTRIRARDGLDLPVWLTIPSGRQASPQAPAGPAVVLVHGGPWARGGAWAWSAMEQFLASRGYVVISPEFRGSLGFGEAHFRAGWGQWGRAMQDDVADAVQWAVKQGWADPSRVCILGASYGGYSALMGLVRHPEMYRCAAAWVAVTDPLLLFKPSWREVISQEIRQYSLPRLIGDPERDAAALREVSPVEQAARIKRPLLLAFSADDRVVPLEHGTRLLRALREQGQEPEFVRYEGEGHLWLKTDTQLDFAARLERFLAQHLGP